MMMNPETAEIECFAKAYHYRNSLTRVFSDEAAGKLLGNRYDELREKLSGKSSSDSGTPVDDGRIDMIMRSAFSDVLVRSAFCEDALATAARLGCRQYMNIGAGYDTYSCRCGIDGMRIIEADTADMIRAKTVALASCGEDAARAEHFVVPEDIEDAAMMLDDCGLKDDEPAFVSLVNISSDLSRTELYFMLDNISDMISEGSSVVFCYHGSEEPPAILRLLAAALPGASEKNRPHRFRPKYDEMEELLSDCGLKIYEFLTAKEAEERFLTAYNMLQPSKPMRLVCTLRFCLAVKK